MGEYQLETCPASPELRALMSDAAHELALGLNVMRPEQRVLVLELLADYERRVDAAFLEAS